MKKPYIIGVTGTYGKTSCVYALHTYLKMLGYTSCLMSSNYSEFPVENISTGNRILDETELNYYLYLAKDSDFLVLEVNEESLAKNIYQNVIFDCKVMTSLDTSRSLHRDVQEYVQLKQSFFNAQDCIRVANKNLDGFTEFNTSDATIFSTQANDNCEIYPLSYDCKFQQSSCTLRVNDEIFTLSSDHNQAGYQNIITTIAILKALELFDADFFIQEYLPQLTIPGRHEVHHYQNRHIVIDSANGKAVQRLFEETTDIEDYNVRSLLSLAGNVSLEEHKEMIQNNFVSLNIYNESNQEMRNNCFVFGGNLYKAHYKTNYWRSDDICFQGPMDEIGYNPLLNFENSAIEVPEGLVDAIYRYAKLTSGQRDAFIKNFWWRSISGLKTALTVHYDKFLQLCESFKALNNKELTTACDYLKTVIDYERQQFSQLANSVNNLPVDKFYLTMNTNSADWSDLPQLEKYQVFFTKPVAIFTSRQEAIKQMILDSQPNDILIVAGRGDAKLYNIGSQYLEFTDHDYIKQVFEEVELNEN